MQAVGANLVVTYAEQNSTKTAATDGTGLGFVIVYDLHSQIVSVLENGPWFDAPWGVALAPQDFGTFSHDLLIANRGSGTIAAFNAESGKFLGNMLDTAGNTLVISGLWGIEVGNRGAAGRRARRSASISRPRHQWLCRRPVRHADADRQRAARHRGP